MLLPLMADAFADLPWILPALVLLVRSGHRIAAATGYLLFDRT